MKAASPRWLDACVLMFGMKRNEKQQEVIDWWLSTDSRFCLLLGGERAGKSRLAALLLALSVDIRVRGEYWVVGPDYLQARPEFTYIYEAFLSRQLVDPQTVSMPVNIAQPWSFTTTTGQKFSTKSSSDITKLASFSVAGIIMAEAAQHVAEVWLKLMGRVSETGGCLILSGTLERGLPWYADLYMRWQGPNELLARSFSLPSWSNTAIYPGGREDKAIKELEAEYPADLFMERFGAEPRKRIGLVLPDFDMKLHVKPLTRDIHVPVELWMDPGQHCYPVLFVQSIGLYTHVLDCIYSRGKIVQDIIPLVMGHPLFQYVDIANGGVIDVAGKQHHANKSQVELWQELAGVSLRSKYVKLDDSIQTLRFRLTSQNVHHEPLLYFNSHLKNTKSPDGTLAMDVLAEPELWKWPDRSGDRNKAVNPVDLNNDAMKAIAYGLVDRYGFSTIRKRQSRGHRRAYLI